MEILHDLEALSTLRGPVYLAIGVFDGVHRGHQALLAEVISDAAKTGGTAAVMTFEPHPAMFFRGQNPPRRLSGPRHKELLLARQGVEHLLVLPFDAARANQKAEDFVEALRTACHPLGGIVVGADWRFGRGRTGDVALLRQRGGFEVDGIPAVTLDGTVISSTTIRHAVEQGDLGFAEKALGRPYSVFGHVVQGLGKGHSIGFPTANIGTDGAQLPPDGVYATRARVGENFFWGVTNLGVRPTITPSGDHVLETHLFDFHGNLYGKEIEVELLHFLRSEKKFGSIKDLRRQIALDITAAKTFMATPHSPPSPA